MKYTPEEIEKMADDALKEIHKHTTLCVDENEKHIFLCGFNAGLHTKVENFVNLPVSRSFAFGECVKVLHCFHGHEFEIGEIVCIVGKSDYDDAWLCRNAKGVEWYLHDEECEVVNCG